MARYLLIKNEKGQSLVEFALILPILLMLVMGIIQFGFIFNAQITVTSAAREGARSAVVGRSDTDVRNRVEEAAVALLMNMDKNNDIVITSNPSPRVVGGKLSVRVTGRVPVIVPGFNVFMSPNYAVSSESVMRVERLP